MAPRQGLEKGCCGLRGRQVGRGSGAEWEGAGGGEGRYHRRRGSRVPGAGGRRAQVGRAAAGRTRSRRGRGSGGRGRPAGRSAPGGGQGPRLPAAGSLRKRLQRERSMSGVQGEVAEPPRSLRGRSARGPCLPGHWGQHSSGSRTGSGQGSGGQRRARHCTLPPCNRGDPGQGRLAVGGRGDPPPWDTSSHGDRLTRQRHCRQESEG